MLTGQKNDLKAMNYVILNKFQKYKFDKTFNLTGQYLLIVIVIVIIRKKG